MIDIAKLLKDAPKSIKLYSPLFGEVEYCYIGGTDRRIWVCTKASMRMFSKDGRHCFTHDGNTIESTECLLFPSKDCRTWEGWKLPVEPKFKVGDWVVTDYGKVSQVVSVDNAGDGYTLDDGVYFSGSWCDMYHLWTIADAKDGDVLAFDWTQDDDTSHWEKIVIFKKYHAKGVKGLFNSPCVEGYGNTFKNGKLALQEEVPYYSKTWRMTLQPATKEQRDLLFAKMKEAGYQWDADKKELHKIQSHYDIKNFHVGMPVLVRILDEHKWCYLLFSHCYKHQGILHFHAGGAGWLQCIPFNEETKHLLGTTDMPSEEYINW